MKRLMLLVIEDPAPNHPPKQLKVKSTAFLSMLGLERFFTINTKQLFQLLKYPQTLLDNEWEENQSFPVLLRIAKGLRAINDRAKRGVASLPKSLPKS